MSHQFFDFEKQQRRTPTPCAWPLLLFADIRPPNKVFVVASQRTAETFTGPLLLFAPRGTVIVKADWNFWKLVARSGHSALTILFGERGVAEIMVYRGSPFRTYTRRRCRSLTPNLPTGAVLIHPPASAISRLHDPHASLISSPHCTPEHLEGIQDF
jgi:hypothetical protein